MVINLGLVRRDPVPADGGLLTFRVTCMHKVAWSPGGRRVCNMLISRRNLAFVFAYARAEKVQKSSWKQIAA